MPNDVQNFQENVIQASHDRPVVVDFWAPWCGPCRIIGPVLEKLDNEAGSDWTLVKVNTDENQNLALQYNIRGIPAVKMFWNTSFLARRDELNGNCVHTVGQN